MSPVNTICGDPPVIGARMTVAGAWGSPGFGRTVYRTQEPSGLMQAWPKTRSPSFAVTTSSAVSWPSDCRKISVRPLRLEKKTTAFPSGVHPNGKAVVFFSNRNGRTEIFRQSLGQDTAELVVTAKEGDRVFGHACMSPEGSWVLYTVRPNPGDPQAPATVMRAPTTGGSPQIVLTGDITGGQESGH